jgi:hypothetical protein
MSYAWSGTGGTTGAAERSEACGDGRLPVARAARGRHHRMGGKQVNAAAINKWALAIGFFVVSFGLQL